MSTRDINVALDVWTPEREAEAARLERAVIDAQWTLAEATQARAEGIRAMLAEGVPVARLAESFGLSRERVYQIRDGRR